MSKTTFGQLLNREEFSTISETRTETYPNGVRQDFIKKNKTCAKLKEHQHQLFGFKSSDTVYVNAWQLLKPIYTDFVMNKTPLFQRTNLPKRCSNYIGTFRNCEKSHKIVAGLAALLSKWGKVYKQGRNQNRKGLVGKVVSVNFDTNKKYLRSHDDLRRSVPIPHSTHFDVYLDRRSFPSGYQSSNFPDVMVGIPPIHLMLHELLGE